MSFKLHTPGMYPKSLNELFSMHPRRRHRYNNKWKKHIGDAILVARCEQNMPVAPKYDRVELTLQRNTTSKHGIRDDDNLHGAWKPVIDALVHHEILTDDTRENIVKKIMLQVSVDNGSQQGAYITVTPL